jgi:hypothetical protein
MNTEAKTVIKVDIHKNGHENEYILKAIGSHNSGESRFTMQDFRGYVNFKKAVFPSVSNYKVIEDWPVSRMSEDGGKTFTLSLTWNEVEELKAAEEVAEAGNDIDDLTNTHFR